MEPPPKLTSFLISDVKDKLELDQVRRLIKNLFGVLPEKEALEIHAETSSFMNSCFKGSRQLGGSFFLDQFMQHLEIDKTLKKL